MGAEKNVTEHAEQTAPRSPSWRRAYLYPLIAGYLASVPFVLGLILLERAAESPATQTLRFFVLLGLGPVWLVAFRFILRSHETQHGKRSKVLRIAWGILFGLVAVGCVGGVAQAWIWYSLSSGR